MKYRVILLLFILCLIDNLSAQSVTDSPLIVKRIDVSGNKRTNSAVILRELNFSINDTINQNQISKLILSNEENLIRTGLFLKAEIIPKTSEKYIDFTITVNEKWYLIPDFNFELADRNFNSWWETKQLYRTTLGGSVTQNNLTGWNDKLTVNLILGWKEKLGLKYRYPYFNNKKTLGFQFETFYLRGHELPYETQNNKLQFVRLDSRYLYSTFNFNGSLIYRPGIYLTHEFQAGFAALRINDTISRFYNPDYLGENKSERLMPFLTYTFTYNKKDRSFYPEKGYYFSTTPKITFDLSNNLKIFSITASFKKFMEIIPRLYYAGGISFQKATTVNLPYSFRPAIGYKLEIRGYEHYVIEGNALGLINSEIKYKIAEKEFYLPFIPIKQFNIMPVMIYFKFFYDAGYVNWKGNENTNDLENLTLNGRGIGVDIVTYYDKIIRLEYSFNDLKQKELYLHFLETF